MPYPSSPSPEPLPPEPPLSLPLSLSVVLVLLLMSSFMQATMSVSTPTMRRAGRFGSALSFFSSDGFSKTSDDFFKTSVVFSVSSDGMPASVR